MLNIQMYVSQSFVVFCILFRTKNKAHRFMLLLTWVMSKLWTYLLFQVEKQLSLW